MTIIFNFAGHDELISVSIKAPYIFLYVLFTHVCFIVNIYTFVAANLLVAEI